jgi:hypothetical protein
MRAVLVAVDRYLATLVAKALHHPSSAAFISLLYRFRERQSSPERREQKILRRAQFRSKVQNFAGFSRVFAAVTADNKPAGTEWRWMQSPANSSPSEFPLSGKITGTFGGFATREPGTATLFDAIHGRCRVLSQIRLQKNREFILWYQGIPFDYLGKIRADTHRTSAAPMPIEIKRFRAPEN